MSEQQRYPLSWPNGWKRTVYRSYAPFGKRRAVIGSDVRRSERLTVGDGLERLMGELKRLGAQKVIISSNLATRQDGLPYAQQPKVLADPGVAVYFTLKGKPTVLACDRWNSVADNMAAIAGHIDSIRASERYGVGTMEQAFAGYAALPPTEADWPIVLGVSPTASRDDILAAHRKLAAIHHPDKGGRAEDMARINAARDRALEGRTT